MSADIGYLQLKISELNDKNKILEDKYLELKVGLECNKKKIDQLQPSLDKVSVLAEEVIKKYSEATIFSEQTKKEILKLAVPALRDYLDNEMDKIRAQDVADVENVINSAIISAINKHENLMSCRLNKLANVIDLIAKHTNAPLEKKGKFHAQKLKLALQSPENFVGKGKEKVK